MADASDPATVAEAAAIFCEEYDDGDQILETVLTIDTEYETWSFDDLPLDSGTFGELVSRGIVTRADDEYRIASRRGVKAGLEGEALAADRPESGREVLVPIAFDARAIAALLGALTLLFAVRIMNYRTVFRDDHVVSPANDPYYYRYQTKELLAKSDGITDVSMITEMSRGVARRRPLTHAANWFFAELLGGDQWAADMVAAWLPVVATVILGVVVYWLAVVITDDVRIGIASVVLLALTPVHAVYTGLGFLEHRAHQYLWLGVTLLTIAWMGADLKRRRDRNPSAQTATDEHQRCPWAWVAAVALGIALSFSAHAWGGSILMFVPVAAYVGLKAVIDIRAGFQPARANAPLLAGLGLGGVLTALLHVRWGWHETFTALVPLVVVGWALVTIGLGELWRRLHWPVGRLLAFEILLAGIGLVTFRLGRPGDWTKLSERAIDLFFRTGIAESTSLFSFEEAVVFGPLAQLGLNFYLAIAVLAWACWVAYRRYEPGWLLLSVYVVFWLVLATLQGRFAAQLSIPLSVLGGFGLVWVLAWTDLARVPAPLRDDPESDEDSGRQTDQSTVPEGGTRPQSIAVPQDRWTLVAIVWIGLLICGASLFYTPSLLAEAAYSDSQYEAAMAIDEHAANADRDYPENFVLSRWGENRMYNYFVNGEARSYEYASDHFQNFLTDNDPDSWYERFESDGVGYVVMSDSGDVNTEASAMKQLHEQRGAGGAAGEPLEHYQAIYVDDGTTAFAVVPGATIAVDQPYSGGEPNETVTVKTEVQVSGQTIVYERDAALDESGGVEVTVPYPGEYTVGEREVRVSPADVERGQTVRPE